jgi:hypothetical protein
MSFLVFTSLYNYWCWRQRMLPSWVSWKSKTYGGEITCDTKSVSNAQHPIAKRLGSEHPTTRLFIVQRGLWRPHFQRNNLAVRRWPHLKKYSLSDGRPRYSRFELLVNGCYAIRWPRYRRYNCILFCFCFHFIKSNAYYLMSPFLSHTSFAHHD